MKRPPRPHPERFLPAAFFVAVTGIATALTPTEWQHRQLLTVAAPGLMHVELPAATFDAAASHQEDLRVIDPAGHEVAYLLDQPPAPAARNLRPASFEAKVQEGTTRIVLATGTSEALSSLTLETPHPFFLRAARVEISPDNDTWTTLDDGVPLFRQWGAEKLDVSLAGHVAAFVRVTVNDNRATPLPFTGGILTVAAGNVSPAVPVDARIVQRDEYVGETVLTVNLDARHVPLAALVLQTAEPLFMRRVTVAIREVRGAVSAERIVGSGAIYRIALGGAPARAQLEFPLDLTPPTRELLVHVHNGDSPPLAIDGITARRRPVSLFFMAALPGTHTLLSGNPQALAPHYDLAGFAGEMRAASATAVVPGDLQDVPDYHPNESLATAPLPDIPLTGAPLDAHQWTFRRDIRIERRGVQELELDLEALARAGRDFADLRILREGNQIPYVLEQPALARSLTLAPVAVPDAKRPAVSVWQLHLPQSGLPVRRVVLSSSTALFQRELRLFEKLQSRDGRAYENTLAAGQWSRTPEPGAPETRAFDLPDRLASDILWLETDNGDNPAIALGSVQLVYPVTRLVFKVEATEGFTLAYGNPEAGSPRYDLNLVAAKLLTSGRNSAHLAAEATKPPARNPLAVLNGGYVFWLALALVVVVLLVIVGKLLPKPPAM